MATGRRQSDLPNHIMPLRLQMATGRGLSDPPNHIMLSRRVRLIQARPLCRLGLKNAMPLRRAGLRFVKSTCRDLAATSGCMPPQCRRGSHHQSSVVVVVLGSNRQSGRLVLDRKPGGMVVVGIHPGGLVVVGIHPGGLVVVCTYRQSVASAVVVVCVYRQSVASVVVVCTYGKTASALKRLQATPDRSKHDANRAPCGGDAHFQEPRRFLLCIEDARPLYPKRMETVDDEILKFALDFIDTASRDNKPFFVWLNPTRMRVAGRDVYFSRTSSGSRLRAM
jgi:hypothetical protein